MRALTPIAMVMNVTATMSAVEEGETHPRPFLGLFPCAGTTVAPPHAVPWAPFPTQCFRRNCCGCDGALSNGDCGSAFAAFGRQNARATYCTRSESCLVKDLKMADTARATMPISAEPEAILFPTFRFRVKERRSDQSLVSSCRILDRWLHHPDGQRRTVRTAAG